MARKKKPKRRTPKAMALALCVLIAVGPTALLGCASAAARKAYEAAQENLADAKSQQMELERMVKQLTSKIDVQQSSLRQRQEQLTEQLERERLAMVRATGEERQQLEAVVEELEKQRADAERRLTESLQTMEAQRQALVSELASQKEAVAAASDEVTVAKERKVAEYTENAAKWNNLAALAVGSLGGLGLLGAGRGMA